VSASIRVSDETKQLLEALKRDGETFDELLERLAHSQRPVDIGAWSDQRAADARAAIERSRESFDRRENLERL
jgi:predicted CopG family antitoxin